jgi:hypothetical protein
MEEFSKKNKKIQEISILFDNLKVTWSKVFPEIEELKKTVLG